MEEIQRFTGLTKEQIEAAIRKRVATESMKKKPEPKAEPNAEPTTTELLSLLKDIQEKLNILLARESHLNGCPTRCD
jgi:hypothetical protein